MPDVQGSRRMHRLASLASLKTARFYRYTATYFGLALLVGAATVFSVPELRAQALGANRAAVAAKPEVKESAILEAAVEAKPAEEAIAEVTAASRLHELQQYIGSKYKVPTKAVTSLVDTAWEVGGAMKLDPLLLLAVMAIESSFNPRAESHMGAQGLMQVMTRIHHKKFEPFGGRTAAWQPDANISVGAQILKDCIARRGSVAGGLTCYVGSPGTNSKYGRKVLAERQRFEAKLAPGALDGLMLASSEEPAKPAAKEEPAVAVASAKPKTVDEEAAEIVEKGGKHLALNEEVTATLTLRTSSFEM